MKTKFKFSFPLAVVVVGFTSIITQIVFLRESIAAFYGHELILGVVLGNWLLLTGVGSWIGGKYAAKFKNSLFTYFKLQLALTISILPTLFLLKIWRTLVTTPGTFINPLLTFIYSLILLAPFCILNGFLFTLACRVVTGWREQGVRNEERVAYVYLLDNIGDMSGGLVFSFILIYLLTNFQSVYFLILLNLISLYLLGSFLSSPALKNLISILSLLFLLIITQLDLETIALKLQYPGQKIIFHKTSLYGEVVVTEQQNQLNFYENAFPLFTTENTFTNEQVVHYPLLQHPHPEKILVISGGVSGTLKEINKYPDVKIDYVELDPLIIQAGELYTSNLKLPNLNVLTTDGRLYIRQTGKKYDVVIIDLPDPESVQLNRFYTLEFFKDVKKKLENQGIISLSLSGGANYLNPEAVILNKVIYHTLKKVFRNVLIIPGETYYYIASDTPLDYDYESKINEKGITTQYLEYYLPGIITPDRIAYAKHILSSPPPALNMDFKPISHYHYLRYWMSLFHLSGWEVVALCIFILAVVLLYIYHHPVPTTILVTGFTAASLEVILMVAFQILYGYIYHKLGVIISFFLLGLVIGSYRGKKILLELKNPARTLAKFDFLLVLYALLLPPLLNILNKISNSLYLTLSTQIIFPVLTLLIGILVGIEFPIALKSLKLSGEGEVIYGTGLLYSVDLVGSCLGAYLVSFLLLPLLGLYRTILLVGILNAISGAYVWFRA